MFNADSWQRRIAFYSQAFTRVAIDNIQATETSPVCKSIRNKVRRPALIRPARQWPSSKFDRRYPFALAPPNA
ncbi:hypothetical protein WM40_23410 [Robbsia andropogonis]|uniref:Uncharacterized protein n=1 Tax=Robbsia andropogonis TaxID=28092 RepID=A0A0F5JVV6_9BURK|nr:hypothetical protein WM40_23410 [Robbsia andropogonis]